MRSGERHHNAKLSNAQVLEIRARYGAGGITQYELATEFAVRQTTISRYVRGLTYTDVAV